MPPGGTNIPLLPIVIIDDEADDIVFAIRALRSCDIENPVLRFCDPEEAIEYFRTACVQSRDTVVAAVFCDVKMPCVIGFDVVRILRGLPRMQKVPVWML